MLYDQNFEQIKSELKKSKQLFNDPFFKPNDIAIVGNRKWESRYIHETNVRFEDFNKNIEWKRPRQIRPNPVFMSTNVDNLQQGCIGDCWLVAELIAICNNKDLLFKIIPQDQNFEDDYCGMFHFKFYWEWNWIDVVVDDFLPVNNSINFIGTSGLYFGTSRLKTFWFPLLEKALAKLYGGYTFLNDGRNGHVAHTLLTGGINENLRFTKDDSFDLDRLWNKLYNLFKNNTMFICSGTNDSSHFSNVPAHHISIVDFVQFVDFNKQVRLVKLQDPNAEYHKKWTGDWTNLARYLLGPNCPGLKKWENTSSIAISALKADMIVKQLYGQWWMSFEDFTSNFNSYYLNYFNPHQMLHLFDENKKYTQSELKQKIFTSCWKYNVGNYTRSKLRDRDKVNMESDPRNKRFNMFWIFNDLIDYAEVNFNVHPNQSHEMLTNIPLNPQFLIEVESESSFFFELTNTDLYGPNSYIEKSDDKHPGIRMVLCCYKLKDWSQAQTVDLKKNGFTYDFFESKFIFHSDFSRSVIYYKVKLFQGKYVLLPQRDIKNDIECRFALRVLYVGKCSIKSIGSPVTKLVECDFKKAKSKSTMFKKYSKFSQNQIDESESMDWS